jgi:hypothetical protein
MTAIPRQAAEASTLRTVFVVTVGLALFVTASVGLGLVIWRDPSAGTSTGPADRVIPADPDAAAGHLEESSRTAAIGDVSMVLPGAPYSLYPDPMQLKGVLESVFTASAPVHERYDGRHTWSAAVLLGRLPAAVNGDLETQSRVTMQQLSESIFDGHPTRLVDVTMSDHAIGGQAGLLLTGRVRYAIDGLPTRYDTLTLLVVGVDEGSVVVAATLVPNDTDATLARQAAAALDSVTIR